MYKVYLNNNVKNNKCDYFVKRNLNSDSRVDPWATSSTSTLSSQLRYFEILFGSPAYFGKIQIYT